MLWFIFFYSVYGFAGAPIWFYNVPSSSMADTLIVGDVFLANLGAYAAASPQRGDVAVFDLRGTTYVKRVIGLPGDRIEIVKGQLIINGKAVERSLASDHPIGAAPPEARLEVETLPNGVSYETLDLQTDGFSDTTPEYSVPAGSYFVLGDNRDNSLDSRHTQFGYVRRAQFIGRATTLVFSFSGETGELRGDRFLRPIR
jgi:signal peptidase I